MTDKGKHWWEVIHLRELEMGVMSVWVQSGTQKPLLFQEESKFLIKHFNVIVNSHTAVKY